MIDVEGPRRPGTWIPWAFIGFFLVVFVANGIMLFFALDTWTGLTTDRAYQEGLAYNEQIAERERQAALGWQVTFEAVPDGSGHVALDLQVVDDRGVAVTAASVAASLTRPTHEGYDLAATLSHIGRGHYAGDVELPLPGQWQVEIVIEEPRGRYRERTRVIVP